MQDETGTWIPLASQYFEEYGGMRNYDVWFPIQYTDTITKEQDRYIHPGHVSHGCVTIYDMNKWNALYDYLISHREQSSNYRYVGDIEVKIK